MTWFGTPRGAWRVDRSELSPVWGGAYTPGLTYDVIDERGVWLGAKRHTYGGRGDSALDVVRSMPGVIEAFAGHVGPHTRGVHGLAVRLFDDFADSEALRQVLMTEVIEGCRGFDLEIYLEIYFHRIPTPGTGPVGLSTPWDPSLPLDGFKARPRGRRYSITPQARSALYAEVNRLIRSGYTTLPLGDDE